MQEQKKPQVASPLKKTKTVDDQTTVDAVPVSDTRADLNKAMGKVTILHGANEVQYDVAGKTVAYVRDALVDVLNIDPNAAPLLNGNPVNADTVLTENSVLEFVRQSGTKG